MGKIPNILTVLGILLIIYSVIEKLIAPSTINLGPIEIDAISGVIIANALMLAGISLRLWNK